LNTGSYALLALWSWDKPVDKSLVSEESLVNKTKYLPKTKKAACRKLDCDGRLEKALKN